VHIVEEQLDLLSASPLWPSVSEVRYATMGVEEIVASSVCVTTNRRRFLGARRGITQVAVVADSCAEHNMTCKHLGHSHVGDEGTTLTQVHAFCARPSALLPRATRVEGSTMLEFASSTRVERNRRAGLLPRRARGESRGENDALNSLPRHTSLEKSQSRQAKRPAAAVAYLHDKGSTHDRGVKNPRLRAALLRGLASQACADAIVGGRAACDVCSLRFSLHPHQHTPGNMWLARCDYVERRAETSLDARRGRPDA